MSTNKQQDQKVRGKWLMSEDKNKLLYCLPTELNQSNSYFNFKHGVIDGEWKSELTIEEKKMLSDNHVWKVVSKYDEKDSNLFIKTLLTNHYKQDLSTLEIDSRLTTMVKLRLEGKLGQGVNESLIIYFKDKVVYFNGHFADVKKEDISINKIDYEEVKGNLEGFVIDQGKVVVYDNSKHNNELVFATYDQANAIHTLQKLTQLAKLYIETHYPLEPKWKADYDNILQQKFYLSGSIIKEDTIKVCNSPRTPRIFTFPSKEIADKFLQDYYNELLLIKSLITIN